MTKYVFLDSETTGLNPRVHEMWELAYQSWDTGDDDVWPESQEREGHFQFEIDLTTADLIALNIGKYYERCKVAPLDLQLVNPSIVQTQAAARIEGNRTTRTTGHSIAAEISSQFHNAHLVAANPAFDQRFLEEFLYRHGFIPNWQYHLIDIRALVAGYLAARNQFEVIRDVHSTDFRPPWRGKRDAIARLLHIDLSDKRFEEHTAEGDMDLVIEQFKIVMGY